MATPWPAWFPQAFLEGTYSATRPAVALRTQPDKGPAIMRRRLTRGVTPFAGEMIMTAVQRFQFNLLFDDYLAGGTGELLFPAPDGTGGGWTVRFRSEPREVRITRTHWRISMEMERLP